MKPTKHQKRVTIKDIAQRLGLSQSTVSRVITNNPKAQLRPATRQRVQEAVTELGYYPNLLARAVATRKSDILGLLTYTITAPLSPWFIQDLIMEARHHGYQLMLELATSPYSKDPLDDQQVQISQMISRGIEGLIIHTRGDADEGKRIVNAIGNAVPAVAFSYAVEGIPSVVLDRTAAIYTATKHLIHLGHRRIGLVDRTQDLALPVAARVQGYLRAVREHGLTPEQFIPNDSTRLDAGYQIGRQIGGTSDRPSAFVVSWSDTTAVGICRGLQEVGVRVPEDVAVVGFGGDEIGEYATPSLTTVVVPVTDICQKVIQLLIDQLNGDHEVKQVTVQGCLIVRESCGASNRLALSRL